MWQSLSRRTLLVQSIAGASLALAPLGARARTPGVALVIGNSRYNWEAALPNVNRDVADVARAFQALGLTTDLVQDADRNTMVRALDKFASAARGASFAAFYFAGHGASWDKDTFLVPVDADLSDPSVVKTLLPVPAVARAIQGAANRLLVFDNCRNNPADGWRQREALITANVTKFTAASAALNGPNALVLFSTAPGRVAVDGPAGGNSPFAAMLLRQLSARAVDLQTLPARLRRDLLIATDGQQMVWDQSTFSQPFVLARGSGEAPSVDPVRPGTGAQIVEMEKAYAFARDNNLMLPAGLVALRPAGGQPAGDMVGSFQTKTWVKLGQASSNSASTTIEPLLMIVLSVSDSTAEIVLATKDWAQSGEVADGKLWRYLTGTVSGRSLDFNFLRSSGSVHERPHTFKWKNAASGTHHYFMQSVAFTRLD
jgi:hypothetical protein